MKNQIYLLLSFLILALGCRDKNLVALEFLEVKTETPVVLNVGELRLVGRTLGLEQSNADKCGFVWSKDPDSVSAFQGLLQQLPAIDIPVQNDSFSVIFRIKPHETIYFRAYAQLGERFVYAKEIVSASLDQVVEMADKAIVDNNSATVFGRLIGLDALNQTLSRYGFIYSALDATPDFDNLTQADTTQWLNGDSDGLFQNQLSGLKFNTAYYVRAYAIDGNQAPIYSQRIDTFYIRDGWEKIDNFPSYFIDGVAVQADDGFVYAGFGAVADLLATDIIKTVWKFSPNNSPAGGIWMESTPFTDNPINKRLHTSLFAIKDTLYVIFGERSNPNTTAVLDFWKYYIKEQYWEQSDTYLSGNVFGPRTGAAGFVLNGKIYVGAGRKYVGNAPRYLNDFWEYTPETTSWRRVKSLPMQTSLDTVQYGRYDAVGFASATHGYVGSGDYYGLPVTDFWRFTPPASAQDSGKWDLVTDPFPGEGRIEGISFVIGNKAYFGSGANLSTGLLDDFYAFDFITEKWSKKTAFQGGRRQRMLGFSMNGLGYAGTGIQRFVINNGQSTSDSVRTDFWRYIPEN
jgi:N-acetylneuraminic acid mutarotase